MNFQDLRPIVIFSVYQGNVNDLINHNNTLDYLKKSGLQVMELEGSYKGITEKSILVNNGHRYLNTDIGELMNRFNQESCLYADQDRNAKLLFNNPKMQEVDLGKLTAVSKIEALQNDAWSYSPITETYYICK